MFGNKKSFGGGVELLVVGLGNPDKKFRVIFCGRLLYSYG